MSISNSSVGRRWTRLSLFICVGAMGVDAVAGQASEAPPGGLTLEQTVRLRTVTDAKMSPDGELIAYLLQVPREPYEQDDGPAWTELHVAGTEPGKSRPFVAGEVDVEALAWRPDGSAISFLAKRNGDEHQALWSIPVDGGEARKVVQHVEDITGYTWSPDGKRVAFLATEKRDELRDKLEEKGFKAEVYEEDLRPVRVWIAELGEVAPTKEARRLDLEGSASEVHWSPADDRLALAIAPTPLIDDHYMKRKVRIVDAESGTVLVQIDNPGKLGALRWSPDGRHLALMAGADLNDPNEGRLMLAAVVGESPGSLVDPLPELAGDVLAMDFRDGATVQYVAHEGVESYLGEIGIDGSGGSILVPPGGPILRRLSLSADGARTALVADSWRHPEEVFSWSPGGGAPQRLTDSNPWLADQRLAPQEAIHYQARDGQRIGGLLIRPLDPETDRRHPLIVVVHGGPEAHFSNGWLTSYSRPGQYAAASGYAVFYPNYRGSTGRGVAFSKLGQADYAGGEFDDLLDGVRHLVDSGLVDERRVGVTGGSYGGFASAWCATALSEHFAAAVMFVGISDQISKFGTTDIPNEMYLVHSRRWPWDHWDWFRERSPVFHAQQARTPILILHGKDDTRVHPSQSMILYRYLKTLGRAPVRLVLYPGEGHGNRKAAARLDYGRRLLRWMDHYLQGPGGEPPPFELEHDPERLD